MADVIDAVRKLIEDQRLASYFHLGQLGRTGVQVIDAASEMGVETTRPLSSQATVVPKGTPIEAGRIALYIDDVQCDDNIASIKWRLPDEGINGQASLRRSDQKGWAVEKFRLTET